MSLCGGLYWAFGEEEKEELVVLEEPGNPNSIDSIDSIHSIDSIDSIVPEKPKIVIPNVAVDSTTDSRIFLAPFYASLSETHERVVRVLHYGDSQIEEDRMTTQIREALQDRYGGSGVGLMPLVQTIPTRTVRKSWR